MGGPSAVFDLLILVGFAFFVYALVRFVRNNWKK